MLKLICAPMATISHEAFRRIVEKFGFCDEYFTEMINASSLVANGPWEKYYLLNAPVPQKIVWQLTGNKVDSIVQATAIVASLGGIGVDINMGCSAPQIYKTGAGIAWMLKPLAETKELIQNVKKELINIENQTGKHLRLSVKCRLGKEDFCDNDFFSFTDMLIAEGVELITLHPRTIKEKYRGLPRYEYVESLALRYPSVPIILNGGISDFSSAKQALEKAPSTAGIMIARAAVQKPWIFAQLHNQLMQEELNPTLEQNISFIQIDAEELAIEFINNVELYQPREFYTTRLQRFFFYYCDNFTFAHYFKTQMLNAKTPDECRKRVHEYFLQQPDDKII